MQLGKEALARKIYIEAEEYVIARLGRRPAVWIYGGPDHNDDRLTAHYDANAGCVRVSDGGNTQAIFGRMTADEVREYVAAWYALLWQGEAA